MSEFSEELLSAYLDGELSADELMRVEAALAQSPQLRQLLAELRNLGGSLQVLPEYRLREDLALRVLRRAEREMLASFNAVSAVINVSSSAAAGGSSIANSPNLSSSHANSGRANDAAVARLPVEVPQRWNSTAMWKMRVWAGAAIAASVLLMVIGPRGKEVTSNWALDDSAHDAPLAPNIDEGSNRGSELRNGSQAAAEKRAVGQLPGGKLSTRSFKELSRPQAAANGGVVNSDVKVGDAESDVVAKDGVARDGVGGDDPTPAIMAKQQQMNKPADRDAGRLRGAVGKSAGSVVDQSNPEQAAGDAANAPIATERPIALKAIAAFAQTQNHAAELTVVRVQVPRSAVEKGQLSQFFADRRIDLAESSQREAQSDSAAAPPSAGPRVTIDEPEAARDMAKLPSPTLKAAGGKNAEKPTEMKMAEQRAAAAGPTVADSTVADPIAAVSQPVYEVVGMRLDEAGLESMVSDLRRQPRWRVSDHSQSLAAAEPEAATARNQTQAPDPSEQILSWAELAQAEIAGARLGTSSSSPRAEQPIAKSAVPSSGLGGEAAPLKGAGLAGNSPAAGTSLAAPTSGANAPPFAPAADANQRAISATAGGGVNASRQAGARPEVDGKDKKPIDDYAERTAKKSDLPSSQPRESAVGKSEKSSPQKPLGKTTIPKPAHDTAKRDDAKLDASSVSRKTADIPTTKSQPGETETVNVAAKMASPLPDQSVSKVISTSEGTSLVQRGLRRSVAAGDMPAQHQLEEILKHCAPPAEAAAVPRATADPLPIRSDEVAKGNIADAHRSPTLSAEKLAAAHPVNPLNAPALAAQASLAPPAESGPPAVTPSEVTSPAAISPAMSPVVPGGSAQQRLPDFSFNANRRVLFVFQIVPDVDSPADVRAAETTPATGKAGAATQGK